MRFIIAAVFLCFSVYGWAQAPNFEITVSGQCVPVTASFKDISSVSGTVVSRIWNFGDGVTSTPGSSISAGHNYNTDGNFSVTLTLVMADGSRLVSSPQSVTVNPRPIADFKASTYAGCPTLTVGFTDLSTSKTGTINKWQWDFGGGSSTQQNPSFPFTTTGTYPVSLIVYNEYGCKSDPPARQVIEVYNKAVAGFTTNINGACTLPIDINFSNTTTGAGIISSAWNFGDGQLSIEANPTINFTTAGTYNVTLTVNNGTNCGSSVASKIIYAGTPQISVAADNVNACANTSKSFSATATPASLGQTVKWSFPDNNTNAYGTNVSHTFSTAGSYNVIVTASSAINCTSEPVTITANISPSPSANFTIAPATLCQVPRDVQFTNTSTPPGSNYSYSWNFGDGQTSTDESPLHPYTTVGNKYVTFTVTENIAQCSSTVSKYVYISLPSVTLSITPKSGCKPVTVNATANATANESISTYVWDWGDNTTSTTSTNTASHSYTVANTYPVTVSINTINGCTATSLPQPVSVTDICDDDGSGGGGGGGGGFGFGNNCANKNTINFSDSYSNIPANNSITTSWDFGDGSSPVTGPAINNYTYTYGGSGTRSYIVTITRKNSITGDVSTAQKNIIIIDEKANFSADKTATCTQDQITFTPQGINTQYIQQYDWNWGDGSAHKIIANSSYDPTINGEAKHQYSNTGSYTVTLTITDKLGCKSTYSYGPIQIGGPSADFTGTDLLSCKESSFTKTFTDLSVPNGSAAIKKWNWYVWQTGGTAPSTPTLSYDNNNLPATITLPFSNTSNAYKAFTVKLIVFDINGCESGPATKSNYVKSYWPKADFSVNKDSMCGNRSVYFYNNSSANSGSYTWSFGDNITSTLPAPGTHTYTTDGRYTVSLLVTEQAMPTCTDFKEKQNFIKIVNPVADFSISDLSECPPIAVSFINQSQNASIYNWTFSDGGNSSQTNVNGHIYGMGGDYTANLSVKGIDGCMDNASKTIHIKGPAGTLNNSNVIGCTPFLFNMSVSNGKNISQYAWDFGDGTLIIDPSETTQSHIYPVPGKYLANVIISSSDGCSIPLKVKDTVIVDEAKADFSLDKTNFCGSGIVGITDKSTVWSGSAIQEYSWDFGDGQNTNIASPTSHEYAQPNTYNITLTVKSRYGCINTTNASLVTVYNNPVAGIDGNNINCLQPGVNALNYRSTINSVDPIANYLWKIDNADVGNSQDLNTDFRTSGLHNLQLIVTSNNNCSDTTTREIIIDSTVAKFSIDKTIFCGKGEPEFTNLSTSASSFTEYEWLFGDTKNSKFEQPGTHEYSTPGNYDVTLYVKNENGCEATSDPQQIIVHNNPVAAIDGKTINCLQPNVSPALNYNYNGTSVDPIATYLWKIDTADVSAQQNLSTDFRKSGTHDLQLIVITNNNCVDTVTKQIIIDSAIAVFSIDKTVFCGNGNPEFTNNSTSASPFTAFNWLLGDNTTSQVEQPGKNNYSTPGNYDVTLYAKNENGCEATSAPQHIVIHNNPVAAIDGKTINCLQPNVSPALNYNNSSISVDPIVTYLWKIDNADVSNEQNLNIDFRTTGAHDLQLIVTTNNNCTDSVIKKIIIDSVHADFSVLDSIKCGDNRTFDFTNVSTAAYPLTAYTWQFGDGETGNSSSAQHTYTSTGNFPVTLQVQTENNCVDQITKQQAAIIYNKPTISLTSDNEKCLTEVVNYSQNVISEDAVVQQGLQIYDVLKNIHTFPLNAGTYTMTYVVETAHGCKDSATQPLVIHPLPSIVVSSDSTICKNTTISLAVSGGTAYLWTTDGNTFIEDATVSNPVITPDASAHYFVHVTNEFDCTTDSSIFIRIDNPINISVSKPVTICEGDHAGLWVKGNTTNFLWSNGNTLSNDHSATPVASPKTSTNYVVKAFSNNVCPDELDSVLVTVVKKPTVDLGPDITTPAGTTITLQPTISGHVSYYNWQPTTGLSCTDCAKPAFTANTNMNYTLEGSTKEGCKASDNINIYVLCNKSSVFIPDAFTPNGDGKNDVFYIMGYGIQAVKSFSVFDRWGKVVFHKENCNANDRNAGWNGLVDGRPVSQSTTFVYTAEVICNEGKSIFLKGTVVLIR